MNTRRHALFALLASLAALAGCASPQVSDYAQQHPKLALDRYFQFYNHRRPHQALAYRTPADLYPHRPIRKRSSP